jgi:hypothetical protein
MMYRVTASFKPDTAGDLLRKLGDGTILGQRPDGEEIVHSMNRAVVTDTGNVVWSESCYCATPLAHERATVYDQHFESMTTEEIAGHQEVDGRSFMEHLAELAKA